MAVVRGPIYCELIGILEDYNPSVVLLRGKVKRGCSLSVEMFDAVEVDVLRNYRCMGSMTMRRGSGRGMCSSAISRSRNSGIQKAYS